MTQPWERHLRRWQAAGFIDEAAGARIREFEANETPRLRWPVIVALTLGGLLVAAGILLFVAAHWDRLGPAARFTLVAAALAALHGCGAYSAWRFPALSATLHTTGTAVFGGAIALAGQIFNLSEHWPTGILLWAAGAWAGWWLLRDWPHVVLAALLTPAWLIAEWSVGTDASHRTIAGFAVLTSIAYLAAPRFEADRFWRQALAWIGAAALLPAAAWAAIAGATPGVFSFALPLALAVLLRGREAWPVAGFAAFVAARQVFDGDLSIYVWCAVGAVALILWGIREGRADRVNLGMAAFAVTVAVFYSSHVLDALDRSLGLAGLGVLFLAGGWLLERLRRRVIAGLGRPS
ncbi:MAG: DUF2157 domain-containing protein [Bryobacteraceae bacterium]